jgi:hypothetical protein
VYAEPPTHPFPLGSVGCASQLTAFPIQQLRFPVVAKQGANGGQYCQTTQPAFLQQASVQAAALAMPRPPESSFWHQAPVSLMGKELASQALLE